MLNCSPYALFLCCYLSCHHMLYYSTLDECRPRFKRVQSLLYGLGGGGGVVVVMVDRGQPVHWLHLEAKPFCCHMMQSKPKHVVLPAAARY